VAGSAACLNRSHSVCRRSINARRDRLERGANASRSNRINDLHIRDVAHTRTSHGEGYTVVKVWTYSVCRGKTDAMWRNIPSMLHSGHAGDPCARRDHRMTTAPSALGSITSDHRGAWPGDFSDFGERLGSIRAPLLVGRATSIGCTGQFPAWMPCIYSLFAIAAELHLSLLLAVIATMVLVAVGCVGLLCAAWRDWRSVLPHLFIGLGVAAYWVLGAPIAGNNDAADPHFYAASPFTLFRSDWLARDVAGLPDAARILATLQVVANTRAGASALLWPIALVGDGLGVGQVTEAGVGLLLVAALLTADLVPRTLSRWGAAATGIGSIGVYNALAILSGGQLQQAVALFSVLACMWLVRACASAPAVRFILAIGGFAISATYPEFLVALPIYVSALALIQHQPPRVTLAQLAALVAGFGLEQAFTAGASLAYLLDQSVVAPGWAPLPNPPGSPLEVLIDVVLQTRPPVALLALAGLVSVVSGCAGGGLEQLPESRATRSRYWRSGAWYG